MTELRGWHLPEQHLLPDALVAFVDGELSDTAAARAAGHIRRCLSCTAEVAAQRQARGAVRGAGGPAAPAGLLASLRAIPQQVELPTGPDGLAVTETGELVAVQREVTESSAPLGAAQPLGASRPLGSGSVLGSRGRLSRRGAQGAGVVVSGLVLGALALAPHASGGRAEPRVEPAQANQPAAVDSTKAHRVPADVNRPSVGTLGIDNVNAAQPRH